MLVKLERHPDYLGARARGERRDHARIDAARHGDDDSPGLQRFGELEIAESVGVSSAAMMAAI